MLRFSRYFTPEEASATLPLVKKIVADILKEGHRLQELKQTAEPKPIPGDDLSKQMKRVGTLFNELEELGCYYKGWDFKTGLVDFPAMIGGREVLLCWKSDEETLEWYHGVEEGFDGRRRIPQLQPADS